MIVIPLVFEERVLGVIELSRLGCVPSSRTTFD
jgi:hypothetical protein